MKTLALVFASLALTPCACTHLALERKALNQIGTVSDLRYREVMNNLAVSAAEPASIPFYSLISGGATEVTDAGKAASTTKWAAAAFEGEEIGLEGGREVKENWTLDPVFEPEKLRAMHCACQWAVCGAEKMSPDCCEELRLFGVVERLQRLPQGWLRVGCKKDVPKCACYVSSWKGKYVWVEPGNMSALSVFTLAMQDIATYDLDALATPTKTEVTEIYSYDDPKDPKKVTKITRTTRVVPDNPAAMCGMYGADSQPPGPTVRPRVNFRGSDARMRALINLR